MHLDLVPEIKSQVSIQLISPASGETSRTSYEVWVQPFVSIQLISPASGELVRFT